jgi:hypothetical protein
MHGAKLISIVDFGTFMLTTFTKIVDLCLKKSNILLFYKKPNAVFYNFFLGYNRIAGFFRLAFKLFSTITFEKLV